MDYIKSVLLDKRSLERPWFEQDFVRSTLGEHFEGRRNHRLLIWSLLSLEWLQRHFIDQPGRGSESATPVPAEAHAHVPASTALSSASEWWAC